MKKKFNRLILLIIITLLFFCTAANAFAAEQSLIRHQDTVISEDQMVESVVVVGGDATVYGSVRDVVVVINGNLDIKKSSRIMGTVLVIGGNIRQEPGAHLTDNVLNISFDRATSNSLLLGGMLFIGVWFMRLVLSLLFTLLPFIIATISKHRLEPLVILVRRSPERLLLIGFVSSLLLTAIIALLAITVVGLPLVILLLLASLVIFLLGLASISLVVGEWLPGNDRAPYLNTLGGSIIIISAINFPFLGSLLLLSLFWISLGIVILWYWENRKNNKGI
ncbi:hypothetical protein SAMN05660649_01535 [Desulfotomaculum arcticum]|uniref:Polymer-forming protein n=1 Tax=Desulfotruncus arcticus DSM 17038 TaxID=1121424 RepID=A0A1I2RMV9_9FIRM|nr:hypothetical protein [Desulfotruncus arcticus]SFG39161.1 hypothetical protein SAMN05660649_01535 [Desulfotomaculum arcticum] [Desulfotruncus arcticus DSM 17038]